jgi:hypothetical protein
MKHLLLVMTAAALMCSQQTKAQSQVKNLYTENASLKVEQVTDMEHAVRINRYLFAGYNTLCLPMSLSATQLEQAAEGITVERLSAIRQEGNILCLYFTDCTSEGIEAGVPYLINSPKSQYLRAQNTDASSTGIEIKTIRMNDGQGNQVAFSSSWDARTKEGLYGIPAKQNVTPLESILVRTTGDLSFLPTRCGFNWEQQSGSATSLEIKHVSASDITAIKSLLMEDANQSTEAYDLSGRKIAGKSQRGLYIQNGKKVVR